MRRRRAAFYARNGSFSRSYNAECAEDEGRLPRTRAAKHLGLSLAAFDAGCAEVGYIATEWHHVGKYAARIDYYDTERLREQPEFWRGAASAYKSTAKRESILRIGRDIVQARRHQLVEEFRQKLIRQRDCSRRVPSHSTSANFAAYCEMLARRATIDQVCQVAALVAKHAGHHEVTPERVPLWFPHLSLTNKQFAAQTGVYVAQWTRTLVLREIGKALLHAKCPE